MDCRDIGHVIVAGCVPLLMRHKEWYVFMVGVCCMCYKDLIYTDVMLILIYATLCGACIRLCGIETYAFIVTLIAIWRWPTRKYVFHAQWDHDSYRIRRMST